ncbi:MAG TPA: DNA polymerase III subunit delta' [Thermodesulfobacteriota bacterium]|nr:DNA polymerase III subunit delta' [Thermodesulfobacteriota bacterium]
MFEGIIGHDFQKDILKRAARDNMASHSYLFAGPDGVGKKLMALEFAKLLNCPGSADSTDERCECSSCRKIERGIHPDVALVEFTGIKNIKVDQVREEIEEKLYLRPFEGMFKVVIVDEAERMNHNAQNAFLKTLEEPPRDSVIILLSSRPETLLPTLRSRCQTVVFNPLPEELVAGVLMERGGMSPEDAVLYSRISGGSIGKALGFDKELMEWRKDLLTGLGSIRKNSASDISNLSELVSSGVSQNETERLELGFRFILLWIRDIVLAGIGSNGLTNTDFTETINNEALKWDLDDLLEMERNVERAWYDIARANANTKLVLDNLFLKLSVYAGMNRA